MYIYEALCIGPLGLQELVRVEATCALGAQALVLKHIQGRPLLPTTVVCKGPIIPVSTVSYINNVIYVDFKARKRVA